MFVLRLSAILVLAGCIAVAQEAAAPATPPKHTQAEITRLLEKANAGDATAQTALGQAYADGNGVAQHFDLALKWYRKAADQGNADAENDIGVMYRTGSGVDQSKEEAVGWYREAARQGSGLAMFNLAASYYNGDGVTIDVPTAYAWFELAKEAGIKDAADAVTRMEAELRPSEINVVFKTIANMYAEGGQIKQNDVESVRWYRMAADRGDKESALKLADALMAGRGTARNYVEAKKWCEAGSPAEGAVCLGNMYRAGLGVDKNPKEAIKHFTRGAQWNNGQAMRMLGEMNESGEAGKADKVEALMWYVRAAIAGDMPGREAALKIKTSMDEDEWTRAQKKMREGGMDPQKVEAFLQAGN